MENPESDAFVFFGATGDLAYEQIFPALQAMIQRGHFDMPIIGWLGPVITWWRSNRRSSENDLPSSWRHHNMAKAYVGTARLEPTGYRSPRSRRGRHVRKEGQRKRGTTRRSPRRSVHSEGISYKPLSGEIGMCLRVGRMGPIKRGWVETEELGPERGPLG
jgi:hypothetical protein